MNSTTPLAFSNWTLDQVLPEIELALQSDLSQAIDLAQKALAAGLEHPRILNLVAFQLEDEDRYAEAMRLLDRAAGLDPSDVLTWNAVGLCLVKQDKRRQAVNAFEHALALNPMFAQAYQNLGATLEALGDYAGAREQFLRAGRLFPELAGPPAGLASLAVREGDWPAARAHAAVALELQPSHPIAMSAIAHADLNEKKFDAAERILRDLVTDPGLDRFDRPSAHCLLGDALDGLGRTDEAFAQYLTGKSRGRELYRWLYERPGAETQLEAANRLTAYFSDAPSEPWSRSTPRAATEPWPLKGHAFLLGFPRSGTTLLENIFASHPEVLALDERVTLREIETVYMQDEAALARLSDLPLAEVIHQRSEYLTRIRGFKLEPEGKVIVDKMPLYTTKLPIIFKLFPDVKILFALRDPRDVVLSCFRRPFQINAGMYQFVTLEGAARYYDAVMRLAEVYREKIPLDLHVIRYEALVADFENEVKSACAFLGIDWRAGLHDFAENARSRQIRTPSAAQVRGGLYSGAGQWRPYAKHLEPIMPILQPWIEKFGYDPD